MKNWLRVGLVLGSMLCLPASSSAAQAGSVRAEVQSAQRTPGEYEALRDSLRAVGAELERRLTDRYEARLDALAMEKRGFEWTVWIFTMLVTLLAGAAAVAAYRFGKSFNDLRQSLREDAAATFRTEFLKNLDEIGEIDNLRAGYQKAHESLREIAAELQGYTALAQAAERASGFDPLVEYYSIDREIDERRDKTVRMMTGDDSVDLQETIRNTEFRQRAATIFERLLSAVRAGSEGGEERKIGAVTLYNAAANASKANLDFVSLRLMEVAAEMSKGQAPEIDSRLTRQQITMSVISNSEAREKIAAVLRRLTGFDLHLTVSEAFNIGLHTSDPSGMADLIEENLPEELRGISYVKLNGARLKLLGTTAMDWEAGRHLFCEGLAAFGAESPTARWYDSSCEEIGHLLRMRPDFLEELSGLLRDTLGEFSGPAKFAKKYGSGLASTLMELGSLDQFISAEGKEALARFEAAMSRRGGASPPESDQVTG